RMAEHIRGKRVLVTGATDGIGRETALELADMGAEVVVHGRNFQKGKSVLAKIKERTGTEPDLLQADFASLQEVRTLAEEIKDKYDRLDVLLNNAGVYMEDREFSDDGYEMTFAVNYLAMFLLTLSLLDLMKNSAPSRIVNVGSMAHASDIDFDNLQGESSFSGYDAYSRSKLCVNIFTFRLAEKLKGTGVTINCLHPGIISTKLLHAFGISGGASVEKGAGNLIHAAASPDLENVTGNYFVDREKTDPASISFDREIQDRLWRLSEEYVKEFL
ncbi:MAG: SDR family oxidoreductase, partial [Thermodesulfobacteriota bacterium]